MVRKLFGLNEGTHVGTEFAKALGITDPFDFNQHKIDPNSINFEQLQSVLFGLGGDDYSGDLEALRILAAENYDLYFLPNA